MGKQTITLDFGEKTIRKIAFTNSREEAERLKNERNMKIYFPSEFASFCYETGVYVLMDG